VRTGTGREMGIAFLTALLMVGASLIQTSAQRGEGVSSKTATPAKWQTFTGPEEDFQVDLPGKPLRTEDAPGPVTAIRSFDLTTENGMMFSISLTDAGGDPHSRDNNVLPPNAENSAIRQAHDAGQEVIRIRRLTKSSLEIELRWREPQTGAKLHSILRQTLRRGRLYHLGCLSIEDGKDVDRALCRRFFGSLRFTRLKRTRL
jgi:hypothetical protein